MTPGRKAAAIVHEAKLAIEHAAGELPTETKYAYSQEDLFLACKLLETAVRRLTGVDNEFYQESRPGPC